MLNEYIDKAMQPAEYETLDDGTTFGTIPGFEEVWANALGEDEYLSYPTRAEQLFSGAGALG